MQIFLNDRTLPINLTRRNKGMKQVGHQAPAAGEFDYPPQGQGSHNSFLVEQGGVC